MATSPHDPLIRDLAADLKPVRRLRRPTLRALSWLGLVAAIALCLAAFADVHALWERIVTAPDMWLAVFGSAATAVLAATAVALVVASVDVARPSHRLPRSARRGRRHRGRGADRAAPASDRRAR